MSFLSSIELLQLGVLGPILTTVSGVMKTVQYNPFHYFTCTHGHTQAQTQRHAHMKQLTHILPPPQNISGMLDILIVSYFTASLSLKKSLYTQEFYSFWAGLERTKGKPGWYNELLLPVKEKKCKLLLPYRENNNNLVAEL